MSPPEYLPAEPDRAALRSDRILWVSIVGAFVVGVGLICVGVWVLLDPSTEATRGTAKALIGAFVFGPCAIALGVFELRHRLRRGAQEPGRHSRF